MVQKGMRKPMLKALLQLELSNKVVWLRVRWRFHIAL